MLTMPVVLQKTWQAGNSSWGLQWAVWASYQGFICALEHVTDEMKAATARALPAYKPKVVHVPNALCREEEAL